MRKPFDVLAERAFLKIGRGDWTNFEPRLEAFLTTFLGPVWHTSPIPEATRWSA